MKLLKITLGLLLITGIASAETLKVDPKKSHIEWVGKKVTGQHNGTIQIKSGHVMVEKDALTGGNFEIDLSSIEVLDLKGDSKENLTNHLKSDDFFSVEKHPVAKFMITNVDGSNITGDLTIKDMTHPLTFPAKITIKKGSLEASAKGVNVDRTLYDIRYGSGKFFKGLGDKVIDDHFTLDITIVAGK